jgi:hypothetical protein
MSVNLDKVAVEKIKAKGLNAIHCKAEELHKHNISAGLLMSFEMVEHLYSPIDFLDSISKESECEYLVITVPYLQQSRVGLHHIRLQQKRIVYPENTHIFELSPPDWKLIFQHSGWQVLDEITYYQYPRRSFWRIMQPVWKWLDFEGFYGVVLKKGRGWADCYHTE